MQSHDLIKRAAWIAAVVLLIGGLIPHFTQATGNPQTSSATPASATFNPPVSPTTRPGAELNLGAQLPPGSHPSPEITQNFRQVHGQPGYWRLVQDAAGVWWFLSPGGKLEFLNTVTTVQPMQESREKGGGHFISTDWDRQTGESDIDQWAKATLTRVKDAGFKGLGAWCNPAFHRLDIPMSQDLNVWAWIDDTSKRFYNPEWASLADQAVRVQAEPLRSNRSLVGYYIDNELDWGDGFAGPSAYFDHLPLADPNRREVTKVIHSLWPSIADFNLTWGTQYKDWTAVEQWKSIPRENDLAYDRLSSAWLSHLAEDYFRVTTAIIHKYDPNHLILGVRFKGYAPPEVVEASRGYTDAQSLNYYVGDARLDAEMFRMMYERSGQPIVISEYSFHSLDGRSGNRDVVGFMGQVVDQQARADGYRMMTSRLARVSYVVGADWFQWCDEPPGGRGDGEDVNFGIVDIHDKPYTLLADAIRQTGPTLDKLHTHSAIDSQRDVWRESFANKPVMHVPYLAKPPVLDGNLGEWKDSGLLSGVRREQTIGSDRRLVQTPEIHLGWTQQGLYVGMEVFDNHIETAPATGWWWTRDHVEMFLSTRPVASDQEGYNVHCHQFFFVPNELAMTAPGSAEAAIGKPAGVVGQWHREGDALSDNIIPQPAIQTAGRVLPDRYVVEMFIPAKAMKGYDPVHEPAMAFNIHVRDFDSDADFFWSAPKFEETQLRPNTWGQLYMEPGPTAPAPHAQPLAASAQASAR
jgi:hypothetical protein